jgi:HD superfamily phosphohydrolase YqeK
MLTLDDAHRLIAEHLGDAPRASHSIIVGKLMRGLAERTGNDPLLWELTGLCHDLDYVAVAGDWSRHGIVAATWLRDDLPAEALDAIRAHDHRTGIVSTTPLASALKLADALAVAHEQLGSELAAILGSADGSALRERLAGRPYLTSMITGLAASLALPLASLGAILHASV